MLEAEGKPIFITVKYFTKLNELKPYRLTFFNTFLQ